MEQTGSGHEHRYRIRSGCDSDGPALIALIRSCWSAYPDLRMEVDREMPELRALASYYSRQSGALWVAEADGGAIIGMIASRPLEAAVWEICRVYVDPAHHGSGLAHTLLDPAEHHAVSAGARRRVLWSDTRFARAHRFYEKRGYVRRGAVRTLNDLSKSREFGYVRSAGGFEPTDPVIPVSGPRA